MTYNLLWSVKSRHLLWLIAAIFVTLIIYSSEANGASKDITTPVIGQTSLPVLNNSALTKPEVPGISSGLSREEIEKGKRFLHQREKGKLLKTKKGLSRNKKVEKEKIHPHKNEQSSKEKINLRDVSSFEAFIRGIHRSISLEIKQFGYDLFNNPPGTFAPVKVIPVGPDYVLGPGDEIKISMWGKINADFSKIIDVEGKITLPQIGVLTVAGLTFREARDVIRREILRYYKPGEVKINISTGKLRTIQVFVVGNAKRPGSYTLSSLSTLVNALFAAGGPAKNGSMRDIEVRRNNRVKVHFDVYDFILRGDKSKDIRLLSGDVIFIPPVGPLVGIAGEVNNPAIYELKGETRLSQLIEMAGGLTPSALPSRIQVERIRKDEKIVIDIDLTRLDREHGFILHNGDVVKIPSVTTYIDNAIFLKGNVRRPGIYAWKEGIHIKDIIPSRNMLLNDTLLDFALIKRIVPPDGHEEWLHFSPERLFVGNDEGENLSLHPRDTIIIFNKWDLMEKDYVNIVGAINKPGRYELYPNMKLADLIRLAGGLKRYADRDTGELTRIILHKNGPETKKISINPGKALDGTEDFNIPLQPDDYIFIRPIPEWKLYKKVSIEGEVKYPGIYTVREGETISSLIRRAGGFTKNAYLKGAIFTRESVRKLQQKQIEEAIRKLEQEMLSTSLKRISTALTPEQAQQEKIAEEQRTALLERLRSVRAKGRISIRLDTLDKFTGSPSDIVLEDGDRLVIPQKPQQIQVVGAVYNPTAFVYEPKATVNYYIKKAGGFIEDANKKGIFILKVDGTAMSRKEYGHMMNNWIALDPGDTIVVPQKIEKIAWLRNIKDITQILYQIAVTAGVLIVTF